MEDQTKATSQATNNRDEAKKQIIRSAAYPSLTIEEGYVFAEKIYNKFTTNEVTRDEISEGLAISEVSRSVAACVQYGWLAKTENGYQITEAFTHLLTPESEKEKQLLLLKAFGTPKFNLELINRFDGLVIPEELANSLVRNHNIAPNAAAGAAEIFMKSGKYVKAITDSRVLKYKVTYSTVEKMQYTSAEVVEELQPEENQQNERENKNRSMVFTGNQPEFPKPEDKKIPIYLTGDKTSWFVYPPHMTADDVEIVEAQLKVVLLRLTKEEKKSQEVIS